MSTIIIRPNNVTEFHTDETWWDNCELCGGKTYEDQCDGDCCPGPNGTAKCIDCGHYSPISNLVIIKEPGYIKPTKIKRCTCDWCTFNER